MKRDLIKEQFKLIEEEITHRALEIDDAALRSVYIDLKKRLNTERMNLCVYFSDVVDKYFTDLKIQNTGKQKRHSNIALTKFLTQRICGFYCFTCPDFGLMNISNILNNAT